MRQGEVGGVIAGCCADGRLGCKRAMFGTGLANSHPGCMNGLRKHSCSGFTSGREGCLGSEWIFAS